MEQSVTRVSLLSRITRVLLVALVSLAGLSVIGVGAAGAATGVSIKSLSPATGGSSGGTSVVIAGSNFGSSASSVTVTFGGIPATSFTLDSASKITAISPPQAADTAPATTVVVTVSGSVSSPAAAGDDIFNYIPSISGTGLIPATSSQTGSTVTITAAGTWAAGQQVSIAGFSNALTSGVYSIVTGGTGSFTMSFSGTTTASGAGSVSPTLNGAVGPLSGGTSVIINGTGFTGATAVDFGTVAARSFVIDSATQITAVTPAATAVGGVDITVIVPTTPTASTSVIVPADDTFNYVSTPTVTGLTTTASPAGGPTGGGTQVTIAGTSFDGVTGVDFGDLPATSFLLNGLNSITAVAPPDSGVVDVTVTTGRGTSAMSPADQYTYNPTLAAAPGTASYANSPGSTVPVTGTSQAGTTLTIDAVGAWKAGQEVGLSGFTNGIPAATYSVLAAATSSFTVTFGGSTSGSGTGQALVFTTVTPSTVTATTTGTGSITLTAPGAWFTGQKVYLSGFANGIATGDYPVTSGTNGKFSVTVPGTVTASGTGTVVPFQAQSFNVSTLVTGGGTINPASVTVPMVDQPKSGNVTVVGTQLVYVPQQSNPTSYNENGTTVWLAHVTTTGTQTVTFSICNSSPDTSCTTSTVTYDPAQTGLYVGNQLSALGLLVTVVEDTGGGVVVPPTAAPGSTFTTITSPTSTDLPSTDVLPVIGIGGYRSITPVPTGVTLVPGSLSVTGGDTGSTGRYTATLCTQAMGYVPNVCTANFAGNFKATYPYIETSLNAGTLIPGGSQLSLPSVSATWTVTASVGAVINSYQTEFAVSTDVESIGFLALDAFPSDLASYLNQGLGSPPPVYAPPSPRWTVDVQAATAPGAPTAVTATPGDASATVSWTAPVSDGGSPITGYTVTSSPGGSTCTSTTTTSCTVDDLTNGTSYTFTVTATNAIGTSPPSSPSTGVIPVTVPGAPTGVTATPGNTSASVSWTAPTDDGGTAITGYTVTSSPGAFTCTSTTTTSCTVNGLANGTSYTFTVTASNAVGTGPASSPSTGVIPEAGVPGSPTGVTATAGDASATVSWTAPSDGGSPITGYTVTSAPGAFTCTSTTITSCTVDGLTNGTSYTFTVTATNDSGTGSPSAQSNAVVPFTVPGTPTGVTATAGNASATVSWTAPSDDGGAPVTGYTVTSSPGAFTCTSATTSCTVHGLTNGTAYTFTVTATNKAGTGGASEPSTSVTPMATVPAAPTGVTATAGDTSASVSWTPGASGGSPILTYTVTSTPSSAGCTVSAPATSCTVTGLTNGTAYTFQVQATNAVGSGPLSNPSPPVTPTANGPIKGYWMATSTGKLLTNGAAVSYGSPAGLALNAPIVGFAPTPDRHGYWFVGADGGVFNYGDAGFYGSTGGQHLNAPIVGIASTSDGKGYWLVAADGGVFNYGDAAFAGSHGATHLNAPIVGVAGQGTNGYLLVGSDGGVFAYGSATFRGSLGGTHLNAPVVGITVPADGTGYYLAAADGGVFAYDAPFMGSATGVTDQPIIGITAGASGGYVLSGREGAVFAYPSSNFFGVQTGVSSPVVGVSS
jgi:fibronectin type 3 domain-containing protein